MSRPSRRIFCGIDMGRIVELSQKVANQIAAGEVVERPSSVIKELVENSLDAGAKSIEVRIKSGGFLHMVVQDDGVGMDEDDIRLSLKRYATSKLKHVHDLFSLDTFGFRGEALPSIASVSRMSMISRLHDRSHGFRADIDAGRIENMAKSGAPIGTRIEVRDLFYNVPARLKFVRSKRSEAMEIDRLIRAFAFVYQQVAWKLFVDDKLTLSFGPNGSKEDLSRAYALLGQASEGMLYAIHRHTDLVKISGVIAAPMASRRDTRGIFFFVNNRIIGDRKLVFAVKTAFRTLLEVGKNPVLALRIDIDPALLDVNVHPRKAEVCFQDERRVLSHIINVLGEFLSKTPWLRTDESTTTSIPEIPPIKTGDWPKAAALILNGSSVRKEPDAIGINRSQGALGFIATARASIEKERAEPETKKLLLAKKFSSLRCLGQVASTYLVAESDKGLVIVDQHAAHERVMFEKIRKDRDCNVASSPLLIPISVGLAPSEMACFLDHEEEIQSLGIESEIFGENTVIIRALPDFTKSVDARSLFKDMLSDLSEYGRFETHAELFDHVCATLACHSAIRAGQRLCKDEIEALFIELDGTDFGAHCPHGRPIVKSFSSLEMKKWFDRT